MVFTDKLSLPLQNHHTHAGEAELEVEVLTEQLEREQVELGLAGAALARAEMHLLTQQRRVGLVRHQP